MNYNWLLSYKMFNCELCGKDLTFKNPEIPDYEKRKRLKKHQSTCKGKKESDFQCQNCGRTFDDEFLPENEKRKRLKRHELVCGKTGTCYTEHI